MPLQSQQTFLGLWNILEIARSSAVKDDGSVENEVLENEDRSTKHPRSKTKQKQKTKHPKTRKRSTLSKKQSTLKLENEAL